MNSQQQNDSVQEAVAVVVPRTLESLANDKEVLNDIKNRYKYVVPKVPHSDVRPLQQRVESFVQATWDIIGTSMAEKGYDLVNEKGELCFGYIAQLAQATNRMVDIRVRAQSGFNTRWVKGGIHTMIDTRTPPNVVIIHLGNNDASNNNGQDVPKDEFEGNTNYIIDYIYSINPEAKIVLITPTISNDETSRRNDVSYEYAQVIRNIASERRCALLDVFNNTSVFPDVENPQFAIKPEHFVSDKLHLNYLGNLQMYHGIIHAINQYYPEMIPIIRTNKPQPGTECRLKMRYPPSDTLKTETKECRKQGVDEVKYFERRFECDNAGIPFDKATAMEEFKTTSL